jgi:hypothetical protein
MNVDWLQELLSDSREVVASLLWEPLFPLDDLRAQVARYGLLIDQAGPQADLELGRALVQGALALLDAIAAGCTDVQRRLAQVAVRYFVLDDDGDDDLATAFGFDDDVEVFNVVVHRIGMNELAIGWT